MAVQNHNCNNVTLRSCKTFNGATELESHELVCLNNINKPWKYVWGLKYWNIFFLTVKALNLISYKFLTLYFKVHKTKSY